MIPEHETGGEPRRVGHRWIDLSIALCAIVVSVTSLGVAVHHGGIMSEMAEANGRLVSANSWPFLQFFQSNQTPEGLPVTTWNVINAGIGPAKIESVEVSWRGEPVRGVGEILHGCCGMTEGLGLVQSSLHGTVLRAGDTRAFLMMRRMDANQAVYDALQASDPVKDMTMRVCYCSVFDECWVSDLRTLHPEPVKACAVPATPFDQ